MLRKTQIALALSLAWGVGPAPVWAQTAPDAEGNATQLKEVTVSATRTARKVDSVPSVVTITTADQIEASGSRDIKDVFRDDLDISVRAQATRFTAAGASTGRAGNEGINIRGLEGNQVLMLIDGIRVPNSFSFGSMATGRGDYLDVDGIKTVEVLRGPASTQFGSDGLAGAVNFRTLDPSDLLKSGQTLGGFVRSSYTNVDNSWANTVGVAGTGEQWDGMLLGSFRQGHEVVNKGSNDAQNINRTTPNPADYKNGYLQGKANLKIDATQQVGFTAEMQKRDITSEVYSARAVQPVSPAATTAVLDLDTKDTLERNRLSVEHRYNDLNAPWVQKAETRVYWQDAKVNQYSAETRNGGGNRVRDNTFKTRVIGLSTQLETNLSGAVNQRLSYGLDWSRSDISALRDGVLAASGETFPIKPFPDSSYTQLGAFVQSEIELGNFSIIPGLRFDRYDLTSSSDGYIGTPTGLSGQATTPRLGAVWKLAPAFAPYAQYSQGFRAPTPDQINNSFTNAAVGYTSKPNPDLKPEQAESYELGFRGKLNNVRYSASVYDNYYKDFISQQIVSGSPFPNPANPSVYQYINLAKARITGGELRAEWQINAQWKANAGLAYAKGESDSNGVKTPLDSVQPQRTILGVSYDAGVWSARANVLHSDGKTADQISTGAAQFAPGAYDVIDVGFTWKPLNNLTFNANINNLLDTTYWRWSDVSGLAASSTTKDAYTAPGRTIQVGVRYDF